MSALVLLAVLAAGPVQSPPHCMTKQAHVPAGKIVHGAGLMRCVDRNDLRQADRRPVPKARAKT